MKSNRNDPRAIAQLVLMPALLIGLGAVLAVNPDSVSSLIGRILGWVLFAVGIGMGVSAWNTPDSRLFSLLPAAAVVLAGMWLIRNPLVLAVNLGRLAGVLLLIRGIQYLSQYHVKQKALPTMVIGAVLLLMPLTASRALVSVCGLVIAVAGIVILVERMRRRNSPVDPDDPNIIDAL